MITISTATADDCATVADLWNAKTSDTQSCWYQAPNVNASYISMLLDASFSFSIASSDDAPVGFGFWCGPAESPNLVALAADTDAVYYQLLAAFCAWGTAQGGRSGWAEIGAAATTEKARMDALGVIEYTPSGYAPLTPDQDPSQRVVTEYRASCDLTVLANKLAAVLGDV